MFAANFTCCLAALQVQPARPTTPKRQRQPTAEQHVNGSTAGGGQLMAQLQAASSPERVVQLVQQAGQLCDAAELTTAVNRLVKLRERNGSLGGCCRAAFQQLAQIALGQQLDPWAVAQFVWAAGKLWEGVAEKQPFGAQQVAWQQQMVAAFTDRRCKPQSVSNGLWGGSKLGWPLEGSLAAAAEAAVHRLAARMQESQQASNTLWAFANAGWLLSSRATAALLRQLEQVLPQAEPQHVSNSMLAAAKLGLRLSNSLQAALLQRLEQVLPQANAQNVANSLWAAAKLGLQPSASLQAAFAQALLRIIPGANSQELANILWACSKLRWSFGGRVLAAAAAAMQQQLSSEADTAGQALCNFLWGLSELQQHLGIRLPDQSPALLSAAAEWADSRWAQLPAIDVVDICYNLARLGHRPGSAWIGSATDR